MKGPSFVSRVGGLFGRVPWILWALLAPALIIGGLRLWTGGAKRIPVVGAGPLASLSVDDAPESTRYDLRVQPREALEESALRIEEVIGTWPDVMVIGLDPHNLEGGPEAERQTQNTLERLVLQAESATAVPVVIGFEAPEDASAELRLACVRADRWWRTELCRRPGLRICVNVVNLAPPGSPPNTAPPQSWPEALREELAATVLQAVHRHDELEASTQVGP